MTRKTIVRQKEILTISSSSRWLMLLSLPFFLVGGIFLFLFLFFFNSFHAPAMLLCAGIFFVIAGSMLALFREKISIDASRDRMVTEKRALVPLARKEDLLVGYTTIVIKEVAAGGEGRGNGRKFFCEVMLTADGHHRRPLVVGRFERHEQALPVATALSRYLGWPIVDLAVLPPVPAVSDNCVPGGWCALEPPARTKMVQRVTASYAEVFIPAAGYAKRERQYLFFACCWPCLVSLIFFCPLLHGKMDDSLQAAIFIAILILLFVALALGPAMWAAVAAIRSATWQTRLLLDANRLCVQDRWLFGEKEDVVAFSDRLAVRAGTTEPRPFYPGLFQWPALWCDDGKKRLAIGSRVLQPEDLFWLAGLVSFYRQGK